MDLNCIKATLRQYTKPQSVSSAHAASIAAPSPEFASILQLRGRSAELKVKNHYIREGYSVVFERWRSRLAEVDLVLVKQGLPLLLVEVKSGSLDRAPVLLSRAQALRLSRLVTGLSERLPVELHLAVVSHGGQVTVFRDPLCDLLLS